MPIARATRPEVVVLGTVVGTRPRRTKADNRLFAYAVTLAQHDGAQLAVDLFVNDDWNENDLPLVGQSWAVVASVSESSYGASLNFERNVGADDLDRIVSAAAVLAGK
jgi:hypothetical protein